MVERMRPLSGVVGEVRGVHAPIHQFVTVRVEVVGLGSVVVGFAKFNGFDTARQGGSLKGVMQFEFALRQDRIDAALLPG